MDSIEDADGLAEYVYALAGADSREPENPAYLAQRIFGADAVRAMPAQHMPFVEAQLVRLRGGYRIYVRDDVPARLVPHHVGHELGHWVMRHAGLGALPELEDVCDMIGAAIVAPRRAFTHAMREFGRDITDPEVRTCYADAFATTEALVTLRYAEIASHAIALVHDSDSMRVRSRGTWPSHQTVIDWSHEPPIGVKKARLRDEPRWALFREPERAA